jgi:hypothetical protein
LLRLQGIGTRWPVGLEEILEQLAELIRGLLREHAGKPRQRGGSVGAQFSRSALPEMRPPRAAKYTIIANAEPMKGRKNDHLKLLTNCRLPS